MRWTILKAESKELHDEELEATSVAAKLFVQNQLRVGEDKLPSALADRLRKIQT